MNVLTPKAFTRDLVAGPAALSARGLGKRFADVVAAAEIDLDARNAEILAVLGENGAGKSTLMKMLYGYYQPDAGQLAIDGCSVTFHSPSDARGHGIGMVFQNFTLIPALSVVENIALVQGGQGLRLDRRGLSRQITDLSERYGLEVRPDALVRDLSVGERQRAEILKVLASKARILILDEPTSVLAPHEVESLLSILRHLRDDGFAILLITHKLREVFACADRVMVLRQGRVVGDGQIAEFTPESLLKMMLGDRQSQTDVVEAASAAPRGPGIRLDRVTAVGADGRSALRDVSIDVPAGQIVGIAAVAGNGQSGLADVLIGVDKIKSGIVSLGGVDVTHASPARRLGAGLRIVSEDPVLQSAVGPMSVGENFMLTRAEIDGKEAILHPRRLRAAVSARIAGSPFPMPAVTRTLETLSGGNVQRVVLTRELQPDGRFFLIYYPSRGLDVASSRAVQQNIIDLRDRGAAILLVSEDLDELVALSDEVIVMHHGHVAGQFPRGDFDPMRLGHLMTGGTAE